MSHAKLVVLNGFHDGAIAAVESAVTLIGSGADCDVVLGDAGVAALDASVMLGGDRPIVRRHAPASGDAAQETEFAVDWYEPWRIGPLWVAVVPVDFEWKATAPLSARHSEHDAVPRRHPVAALGAGLARAASAAAPLGLVAGVLLAGTLAFGHLAGTGSAPNAAKATPGQIAVARLQRSVGALQLADVKVLESPRLALDGFVATAAQLEGLSREANAAAAGQSVQIRVTVGEELARRARDFLADPGIAAAYEGGGRIVLSGQPAVLKKRAALDARLALLRADLGAGVEVRDVIDNAHLLFAAAQPTAHRLPVRITEVQADAPAHFRTSDGARFFEGARLPDGAEVVRIGADEILFRKSGREIRYPVVE